MEEISDLFTAELAEVTESGIIYNGIIYSCSIAIHEQWYLRTPRKVFIYIDSSDSDYIFILLNDGNLSIAFRVVENTLWDLQDVEIYQEGIRSLKQRLKNRRRKI